MAIYDVIKCESTNPEWIIYKYNSSEFNTRSKLIVSTAQVAILVHNGRIEKILEEGSYRLDTELLPFVKGFVKGVYGGNNPYPINPDHSYIGYPCWSFLLVDAAYSAF